MIYTIIIIIKYDHRTNNACEPYHHILNSKWNSNPTIWKFLNIIRNEEKNLRIEINNIKNDINLKLISYEKMTKKYYDCYDESIKKINDSNSNHKRKDIINVWHEAALELPIYDYKYDFDLKIYYLKS